MVLLLLFKPNIALAVCIDLHSNMVLLLRCEFWPCRTCQNYLHSNMVLLLPEVIANIKEDEVIYIPIWCYFYLNIILVGIYNQLHLHSNMVLLLRKWYKCSNVFQPNLHSNMVLLLLVIFGYITVLILNLYSNMVLLLLDTNKSAPQLFAYLHSNMVLLLHIGLLVMLLSLSTFTFQYGATSTI